MASKHKSPFKGINHKMKKPRSIKRMKAPSTMFGYAQKDRRHSR